MPTYLLKFERYIQEAAWKSIRAPDLESAMTKASYVETDDLKWEAEEECTAPRLYGVFDGRKNVLVHADIAHRHDTSWTDTDLLHQKNNAPITDEELSEMNAALKKWLLAMDKVPPVFSDDPNPARWVYLMPWDFAPKLTSATGSK